MLVTKIWRGSKRGLMRVWSCGEGEASDHGRRGVGCHLEVVGAWVMGLVSKEDDVVAKDDLKQTVLKGCELQEQKQVGLWTKISLLY